MNRRKNVKGSKPPPVAQLQQDVATLKKKRSSLKFWKKKGMNDEGNGTMMEAEVVGISTGTGTAGTVQQPRSLPATSSKSMLTLTSTSKTSAGTITVKELFNQQQQQQHNHQGIPIIHHDDHLHLLSNSSASSSNSSEPIHTMNNANAKASTIILTPTMTKKKENEVLQIQHSITTSPQSHFHPKLFPVAPPPPPPSTPPPAMMSTPSPKPKNSHGHHRSHNNPTATTASSPQNWKEGDFQRNKMCMAKLHSLARMHGADPTTGTGTAASYPNASTRPRMDTNSDAYASTSASFQTHQQKSKTNKKSNPTSPSSPPPPPTNNKFIDAILGSAGTTCGMEPKTQTAFKKYVSKPTSPTSVININFSSLKEYAQEGMQQLFSCTSNLKDVDFEDRFGEIQDDLYYTCHNDNGDDARTRRQYREEKQDLDKERFERMKARMKARIKQQKYDMEEEEDDAGTAASLISDEEEGGDEETATYTYMTSNGSAQLDNSILDSSMISVNSIQRDDDATATTTSVFDYETYPYERPLAYRGANNETHIPPSPQRQQQQLSEAVNTFSADIRRCESNDIPMTSSNRYSSKEKQAANPTTRNVPWDEGSLSDLNRGKNGVILHQDEFVSLRDIVSKTKKQGNHRSAYAGYHHHQKNPFKYNNSGATLVSHEEEI